MSFLSRHRPICAVIQEIREIAEKQSDEPLDYQRIVALCDEARDYAQRMSAKLIEYKKRET